MSEAAKSRFAIDLDEIERQIREATHHQVERSRPAEDDPLAELARIVGHEAPRASRPDPVLASRARTTEPVVTPTDIAREFDDLFGGQQQPATGSDYRYAEAQPDQVYADQGYGYAARQEPTARAPASPPAASKPSFQDEWTIRTGEGPRDGAVPVDLDALSAEMSSMQAHDADWRATSPAYGAGQDDDRYGQIDEHNYAPGYGAPLAPPPRNRVKTALIAVGCLVGVGVAGVGAAMVLRGPGGSQGNGGPPLIEANNAPLKVQPVNPGGMEIPDQNKHILERPDPNAPATRTKVVNNEEQPIDVNQAVRSVRTVMPSPNGTQAAPGGTAVIGAAPALPSANSGLGEPRRVKTISIKPPEPPPSVTAGIPSQPPQQRSMQLPTDASQAAAVVRAQAQDRQRVAAARRTTPTEADAAAPPDGGAPLAITPTPKPPRPVPAQRTAALQPQAPATDAPAAESPAASTGGAWAVQLASETSEEGARAVMARLKGRYSELANHSPSFRRAEVNGTTRYRVRVGGMSREAADQLCTALKGKGGAAACMLTRN